MVDPTKPLNSSKQETFCQLMAADLDANGTKAAVGAGFAVASASIAANKLLKLAKVQARIVALREGAIATAQDLPVGLEPASTTKVVEGAAADVIRELQRLAYSDVTALFDHCSGDLLTVTDMKALPEAVRRVIKGVKIRTRTIHKRDGDPETETTYELTLWPKDAALRMLAQYHGLLKEVVETRNLTVEDAIKEARRLAGQDRAA